MVGEPATAVAANDFARQWRDIRDDALVAVDRVGESGWLVLGEEVREFERELASWWGLGHAVGVASGLDALEIGLRCAGIGPGDRVLTTPLTAFATTLAIVRAGAEPVWCDVEESGGLDFAQADKVLRGDQTIKALLPVHLYGHPLDPVALRRLAEEHGVAVIEDCAQSVGASRDGAPTGAAGIVAATSFYPTKNLGALGDGGALLTDDAEVAESARTLRDYGQTGRYQHTALGLNSRLDELHAAVLRSALLPRLDAYMERRREVAVRYEEALAGTSLEPIAPNAGRSARHLFPVLVPCSRFDALPAGSARPGGRSAPGTTTGIGCATRTAAPSSGGGLERATSCATSGPSGAVPSIETAAASPAMRGVVGTEDSAGTARTASEAVASRAARA